MPYSKSMDISVTRLIRAPSSPPPIHLIDVNYDVNWGGGGRRLEPSRRERGGGGRHTITGHELDKIKQIKAGMNRGREE